MGRTLTHYVQYWPFYHLYQTHVMSTSDQCRPVTNVVIIVRNDKQSFASERPTIALLQVCVRVEKNLRHFVVVYLKDHKR